jgi:hypothetical protein
MRMSRLARLLVVLGIAMAVIVPLLLLVHWGHVHIRLVSLETVSRAFDGSDLQQGFRTELIVLSGVVVAAGLILIFRPLQPAALLLCCAATIAQIVLIAIEWNTHALFAAERANPYFLNVRWSWASTTLLAALVTSGVGLAAWLGLLALSASGKRCPDCAERVRRDAIDCPHCGYQFQPPRGLKRCEACQRPVKADARVCRYCNHRFGEPVERAPASVKP